MPECFLDTKSADSTPLIPVVATQFQAWLAQQDPALVRWLTNTGFTAKPGSLSLVPGADGTLDAVVVGVAAADDPWSCGDLPTRLPQGSYYLAADWQPAAVAEPRQAHCGGFERTHQQILLQDV